MSGPLFALEGLRAVSAEGGTETLRGVDLALQQGELHALLVPSQADAAALAAVLLGSPSYAVTGGAIRLSGEDISAWGTDVRAKAGLFVTFRDPQAVPGVSVSNLMHQALSARKRSDLSGIELRSALETWTNRLGLPPAFADRPLNEEPSSIEKIQSEILQMAMLEPDVAVLDLTDPTLGHAVSQEIAAALQTVRRHRPGTGTLVMAGDRSLLDALEPNRVHLLVEGEIVESSAIDVAEKFEPNGFAPMEAQT